MSRTTKVIEPLPESTRIRLLRYARETLVAITAGRAPGAPPTGGQLDEPAAAFVTLRCGEDLRGCIGRTRAEVPLGPLVAELTQDSATRDPRFPPVTPDEVDGLTIEISRLSQPVEASEQDLEPGRHGVIVRKGAHVGLLLPQVAVEYNCTRADFLDLACRKAGLPEDAWRGPGVTISTFEAEVFGE